jgi:hypothetical protein
LPLLSFSLALLIAVTLCATWLDDLQGIAKIKQRTISDETWPSNRQRNRPVDHLVEKIARRYDAAYTHRNLASMLLQPIVAVVAGRDAVSFASVFAGDAESSALHRAH